MAAGVILGAAGVVGLVVFLALYGRAFPQAAVELRVSRAQAREIARRYVTERGFDLAGYRSAVAFEADQDALAYFERTLGPERASALAAGSGGGVPLWFWAVRWFVPLQPEQFRVHVASSGDVIMFRRWLDEEAAGATLEQSAGRLVAEEFARAIAAADLSGYEPVGSWSQARRRRTDHEFTWRQKAFNAGGAQLWLQAGLQGERVGAFLRRVKVPDAFVRSLRREQAVGALLSQVSLVVGIALVITAAVVFLEKFRVDDVRWSFALPLAIAAGAAGVLNALNSLPLVEMRYRTELDHRVFLARHVLARLVAVPVLMALALLVGGAGEALARETRPATVAVADALLAGDPAAPGIVESTLAGYAVAGVFLGYLAIFYAAGRRFFGVWLPPQGPYANVLSTPAPFLDPLTVGLTAAVGEELTYRLLAIPLLEKYVHTLWPALLVPAVAWAFGHSRYAVYPVYVRGIELTLAGLAFGYAFVTFGVWTVIVAHYAVNAVVAGMPLVRSKNGYLLASGTAVVVLALVPAAASLLLLLSA